MQANHVALGGTFDILHIGHISLLEKAFKSGKFVTIGITTDKFCKQSGKVLLETQRQRKKGLQDYLKSKNWTKRAKIIWLNDIYGIAAKDKLLQAIIVSRETVQGADEINKKRAKNKLKELKVIICPQVLAGDGKKISSGRIKSGEISKEGISYPQLLSKIAGKRFTNNIRQNLKKPFAKMTKIARKARFVRPLIAVGDVTAQNLLKNDIMPDISIVDFFVNRKRAFENLAQIGFGQPNPDHVVINVPGQVSKELILAIQKALSSQNRGQIILVDGEEDLAFIPALLLSPIPATILYGQPGKGAVEVAVTPSAKDKLCRLLQL